MYITGDRHSDGVLDGSHHLCCLDMAWMIWLHREQWNKYGLQAKSEISLDNIVIQSGIIGEEYRWII